MKYEEVVAQIYEDASRAALDPAAWSDVGHGMRAAFNSPLFAFMGRNNQTAQSAAHLITSSYDVFAREYLLHYPGKSLLFDDMSKRPAGSLYSDQFFPDYDAYNE